MTALSRKPRPWHPLARTLARDPGQTLARAEHGITRATRDRRAAETYRVLDVAFELID